MELALKFLLKKYFNFNSEKDYQTADWRVRPLAPEMIAYARTDTHFLIPLFDILKNELLAKSTFISPESPPGKEIHCVVIAVN